MRALEKSPMEYIPRYGLGHGIGLSLQESPLISEEVDDRLEEGMCFTLRLTLKEKKGGDSMIGNTICISKNNPLAFTNSDI
jgi:Xaa-Pro aminopeptidase